MLKSTFLPRAIGVLMAADGLASYLAYGFTSLLAPGGAAHLVPWIQLPTIVGKGSLCLWLLIRGVDTGRWTQQASAATGAVAFGRRVGTFGPCAAAASA